MGNLIQLRAPITEKRKSQSFSFNMSKITAEYNELFSCQGYCNTNEEFLYNCHLVFDVPKHTKMCKSSGSTQPILH